MKVLLMLMLITPLWGHDGLNIFLDALPDMLNEYGRMLREQEQRARDIESLDIQRQRLVTDQKRLALEQQQAEMLRRSQVKPPPQTPARQSPRPAKGTILVADLLEYIGNPAYESYDDDGNGIAEGYGVDLNNDKKIDAYLVDGDEDGVIDGAIGDNNTDGVLDMIMYDHDKNGTLEYWILDSDYDGVWDKMGVDTDNDYKIDVYLEYQASENPFGDHIKIW